MYSSVNVQFTGLGNWVNNVHVDRTINGESNHADATQYLLFALNHDLLVNALARTRVENIKWTYAFLKVDFSVIDQPAHYDFHFGILNQPISGANVRLDENGSTAIDFLDAGDLDGTLQPGNYSLIAKWQNDSASSFLFTAFHAPIHPRSGSSVQG